MSELSGVSVLLYIHTFHYKFVSFKNITIYKHHHTKTSKAKGERERPYHHRPCMYVYVVVVVNVAVHNNILHGYLQTVYTQLRRERERQDRQSPHAIIIKMHGRRWRRIENSTSA